MPSVLTLKNSVHFAFFFPPRNRRRLWRRRLQKAEELASTAWLRPGSQQASPSPRSSSSAAERTRTARERRAAARARWSTWMSLTGEKTFAMDWIETRRFSSSCSPRLASTSPQPHLNLAFLRLLSQPPSNRNQHHQPTKQPRRRPLRPLLRLRARLRLPAPPPPHGGALARRDAVVVRHRLRHRPGGRLRRGVPARGVRVSAPGPGVERRVPEEVHDRVHPREGGVGRFSE